MKLYEYAVIYDGKRHHETGEFLEGEKPEVLAFEKILAEDDAQAQIIAARAIPEEHLEHLDRVTIAVRPF